MLFNFDSYVVLLKKETPWVISFSHTLYIYSEFQCDYSNYSRIYNWAMLYNKRYLVKKTASSYPYVGR